MAKTSTIGNMQMYHQLFSLEKITIAIINIIYDNLYASL